MDPPACEAEPADACDEAVEVDVAPIAVPPLIVPALPRASSPPRDPPMDARCAIAGMGGECGAIMAWGAALPFATLSSDMEALGPPCDAGAGCDGTNDLELAWVLATGVDGTV
jgi:hypothetical protein